MNFPAAPIVYRKKLFPYSCINPCDSVARIILLPQPEHVITICDHPSFSPFTLHPPHPFAPAQPAIATVVHTSQRSIDLRTWNMSVSWICRNNVPKNRDFVDASYTMPIAHQPDGKCPKPVHTPRHALVDECLVRVPRTCEGNNPATRWTIFLPLDFPDS